MIICQNLDGASSLRGSEVRKQWTHTLIGAFPQPGIRFAGSWRRCLRFYLDQVRLPPAGKVWVSSESFKAEMSSARSILADLRSIVVTFLVCPILVCLTSPSLRHLAFDRTTGLDVFTSEKLLRSPAAKLRDHQKSYRPNLEKLHRNVLYATRLGNPPRRKRPQNRGLQSPRWYFKQVQPLK
jgi:hypothetical protein